MLSFMSFLSFIMDMSYFVKKIVWLNKSEFKIKVYDQENSIAKENNKTVMHTLIISIKEVKNQTANSQLLVGKNK